MSNELEIIDLKIGEGKEAVKGALITTHYTGWLEDGTVTRLEADKRADAALRQHQRLKSAARTNIQNAFYTCDRRPCTQ